MCTLPDAYRENSESTQQWIIELDEKESLTSDPLTSLLNINISPSEGSEQPWCQTDYLQVSWDKCAEIDIVLYYVDNLS